MGRRRRAGNRLGAGWRRANGSDRVVIIWNPNDIQKTWLQVTVAANSDTGLIAPDVFYFANALADSGTGNNTTALTNATDELAARTNALFTGAFITDPYDYNRDGRVNATDRLLARNNGTINANCPSSSISARRPRPRHPQGGSLSDGGWERGERAHVDHPVRADSGGCCIVCSRRCYRRSTRGR